MSINQRLKIFVKSINSNPTAIGTKIGVSQTSLLKAIKGETLPSSKILVPLKENYPNLNMNWLLIGQGDMLLDETGDLEERIRQRDKMLEILEASVKDLRDTVQLQKKNLAEKDKQIKKLKELTA